MMDRRLKWAVVLVAMGWLSGCATIVSGDETTTELVTDPAGAQCTLTGDEYRNTVTTPVSVTLDSDAAPITIACEADRHQRVSEEIDTSIDGTIFGNILIGGLIGVVVDAASGSGQKYPQRVELVMIPTSFPSVAAREAWYERQKQRLEERYAILETTRPPSCEGRGASFAYGNGGAGPVVTPCTEDLAEKLAPLKQAELDELERIRMETPIEQG